MIVLIKMNLLYAQGE